MQGHDCDVVVVGGGPAGAAAAARLAGRGFRTVLVDRASFPRDKVCGDFVGPMALAELADLGVAQLEAFGATSTDGYPGAARRRRPARPARASRRSTGFPATAGSSPGCSWTPGSWTRPGRPERPSWTGGRRKRCCRRRTRSPSAGDGAAGPWQLRARLLLGADGSNSMVARTLRGGAPPGRDRITAVRAYFDDVEGPDGQGDIWFRSDTFPGYHWLFPAAGGSANLGVGMLVSTYPQSAPQSARHAAYG